MKIPSVSESCAARGGSRQPAPRRARARQRARSPSAGTGWQHPRCDGVARADRRDVGVPAIDVDCGHTRGENIPMAIPMAQRKEQVAQHLKTPEENVNRSVMQRDGRPADTYFAHRSHRWHGDHHPYERASPRHPVARRNCSHVSASGSILRLHSRSRSCRK